MLVRCDAAPALGVGHLVRGMAVALAARDAGWEVVVAGRVDTPWAHTEVVRAGLEVVDPGADDDLVGLATRAGASALHVDHYGLPADGALLDACTAAGVTLSNVADFGFGARPAHVTVNPNFGARSLGDDDLAGPAYALVRAEVRRARESRESREAAAHGTRPSDPVRGVVVMGGTDPFGATAAVVDALLASAPTRVDLDVLTPDAADLVHRFRSGSPQVRLRFRTPVPDLPRLLAESDVAVTAAGTTLLELACIGVPAAALCVTENQRVGYEAAVSSGAVLGLGGLEDGPAAWTEPLTRLLAEPGLRRSLTATGRTTVDGRGAERLVQRITDTIHGTGART